MFSRLFSKIGVAVVTSAISLSVTAAEFQFSAFDIGAVQLGSGGVDPAVMDDVKRELSAEITAATNALSSTIVAGALTSESDPVFAAWTNGASIVAGESAIVNDDYDEKSVAIGKAASADNLGSVAIGHSASADGMFSVAVGYEAGVTEEGAVSVGSYTWADVNSVAIGTGARAAEKKHGSYPKAYGAKKSVAIGCEAEATHPGAVAIGCYYNYDNVDDEPAKSHGTNTFNIAIKDADHFYFGDSTLIEVLDDAGYVYGDDIYDWLADNEYYKRDLAARVSWSDFSNSVASSAFTAWRDSDNVIAGNGAVVCTITSNRQYTSCVVVGKDAVASNSHATAIGAGATALGSRSTAIGDGSYAPGNGSVAFAASPGSVYFGSSSTITNRGRSLWAYLSDRVSYSDLTGSVRKAMAGYVTQADLSAVLKTNAEAVTASFDSKYLKDVTQFRDTIEATGIDTYDWYVSAIDGSDSRAGTSRAEAFQTLERAYQAASGGDVIGVFQGSYTYPASYATNVYPKSTKQLKFVAVKGPSSTSIIKGLSPSSDPYKSNGGSDGRIFGSLDSQWTEFSGFTFTYAAPQSHKVTQLPGFAAVKFTNCVFRDITCWAGRYYGRFWACWLQNCRFYDCTFAGNESRSGMGGWHTYYPSLFESCIVEGSSIRFSSPVNSGVSTNMPISLSNSSLISNCYVYVTGELRSLELSTSMRSTPTYDENLGQRIGIVDSTVFCEKLSYPNGWGGSGANNTDVPPWMYGCLVGIDGLTNLSNFNYTFSTNYQAVGDSVGWSATAARPRATEYTHPEWRLWRLYGYGSSEDNRASYVLLRDKISLDTTSGGLAADTARLQVYSTTADLATQTYVDDFIGLVGRAIAGVDTSTATAVDVVDALKGGIANFTNIHSVVFLGYDGGTTSVQRVRNTLPARHPDDPTSPDSIFNGWGVVDGGVTNAFNLATAVTNDMTVVSMWIPAAADVTMNGETRRYVTLAEATKAAVGTNGSTTAYMTILRDCTFSHESGAWEIEGRGYDLSNVYITNNYTVSFSGFTSTSSNSCCVAIDGASVKFSGSGVYASDCATHSVFRIGYTAKALVNVYDCTFRHSNASVAANVLEMHDGVLTFYGGAVSLLQEISGERYCVYATASSAESVVKIYGGSFETQILGGTPPVFTDGNATVSIYSDSDPRFKANSYTGISAMSSYLMSGYEFEARDDAVATWWHVVKSAE